MLYAVVFVLGVVSSETVRRAWNKYVAPKVAEIESEIKAKLP